MRVNIHGGEERLIQLRQLAAASKQLKQALVESHDKSRPYRKNCH
jgi:hypothetical protein